MIILQERLSLRLSKFLVLQLLDEKVRGRILAIALRCVRRRGLAVSESDRPAERRVARARAREGKAMGD